MQTHTFKRPELSFACLYRTGSAVALFIDTPEARGDMEQYSMSLPAFRQFAAALSLAAEKMAEAERNNNTKNLTPETGN